MLDQLVEDFRKATESALQMQQEMYRHCTQQWLAGPQNAGVSAEWARTMQKRWMEMSLEMLHKHREALESTYLSGIQVIEQTFRVSEAKSSEEYRRIVEDLWRQLLKTFMERSESQLRDFQKWAEQSFEVAQKATAA
jgi:hypothetical protein